MREAYHQTVLEALCAFVRKGTRGKVGTEQTTEIQAALMAIRRRASGPGNVDSAGVNITGAILSGADLSGADLGGSHLMQAHLAKARLIKANLRGRSSMAYL
jgi:hypothetical protein